MFKAYLDDSGSRARGVGGCVASHEARARFEPEKYQLGWLHAADFESTRAKEFQHLSDGQRSACRHDLLGVERPPEDIPSSFNIFQT